MGRSGRGREVEGKGYGKRGVGKGGSRVRIGIY